MQSDVPLHMSLVPVARGVVGWAALAATRGPQGIQADRFESRMWKSMRASRRGDLTRTDRRIKEPSCPSILKRGVQTSRTIPGKIANQAAFRFFRNCYTACFSCLAIQMSGGLGGLSVHSRQA